MTLACPMRVCLSRNLPEITHGIVLDQRRWTCDGRLYCATPDDDTLLDHEASSLAKPGSQLVHAMTHELCAYGTLLPTELELVWAKARQASHTPNHEALLARDELQLLFNAILEATPSIFDASLLLDSDSELRSAHVADLYCDSTLPPALGRFAPIVRCGKLPPKALIAWLHDRSMAKKPEELLA